MHEALADPGGPSAPDRTLPAVSETEDLRDLFENAPCGYLSAQGDGRIIKANHTCAAWLGYPPDSLVGRRFQTLLNIAGRIYYETHFMPLLRMQGFFNEVALDLVRADGSILPVLVNAVERRDEAGSLRFIRVTIFNASDRRRYERELLDARRAAEQASAELRVLNLTLEARIAEAVEQRLLVEDALRQSQKVEAIGQLTGGVAHDFNNLLTVICGSVDLLRRPNLPEDRRRRYIDAIGDTADRAAKLTGQLLAFARRQALQPEAFSVGAALAGITEMVTALTGSRIRLDIDVPDVPCIVHADPNQFDTALVNMAVNARDAMNGEGRLGISVRAVSAIPALRSQRRIAGDFVAISLSDSGSGIEAARIDRIFEPFFTTKSVGQGTGLGLSQVFGFAKQSGGEVQVESEPGRGSVFTLFLPRLAQVEPAPHDADDLPLLAEGHGACILVIEDNVEVGTFAVQTLRELGYKTVLAHDADSALIELARDADRFDVVFSDVTMPGRNGIELGQDIRRLYRDLPVVLTSGYSDVLATHGASGFDLLHKPYSIDGLSRILRKAAASRRR